MKKSQNSSPQLKHPLLNQLPSNPRLHAFQRQCYSIPVFIETALTERGLMTAYHARPDYQQNDYVGWITRAKRSETTQKRLQQILDELTAGDAYMNMRWEPN